MANRKQKKGAGPQPQPVANPAAATPEQIAAAQQQAQQRLRTEFAVLKQRFAEVSVALTIAEAEREQLIQQLRASQQTIESLTASLAEAQKKGDKKSEDEDGEEEEAEES